MNQILPEAMRGSFAAQCVATATLKSLLRGSSNDNCPTYRVLWLRDNSSLGRGGISGHKGIFLREPRTTSVLFGTRETVGTFVGARPRN